MKATTKRTPKGLRRCQRCAQLSMAESSSAIRRTRSGKVSVALAHPRIHADGRRLLPRGEGDEGSEQDDVLGPHSPLSPPPPRGFTGCGDEIVDGVCNAESKVVRASESDEQVAALAARTYGSAVGGRRSDAATV